MHRWKHLEWEDFQGFVKPFTGWGAGISSSVFVEYDSIQKKYSAYAAMNNQYSWKSRYVLNSDYVLNHEQYHFNITEYHARKLNGIFENKDFGHESQVMYELLRIRSDLYRMQIKYDAETDHSLNRAYQKKWEYQIDSLLNKSEDYPLFPEKEKVELYFPEKPKTLILTIDHEKYSGYILEKYDATFWIVDLEIFSNDTLSIESFAAQILANAGQTDIFLNRNLPHQNSIFESYSKDTLKNEIVLDKFLLGKNTTFWLKYKYPNERENREIFQVIGDQFFGSYRMLDE
ncbi:hypothetical protein V8V91_14970 [Algoriphagus halophilus]|uniref:hypothetical protein n=1 Tax=Algoriphagus halophilus TaxID=226505 RepID=UPI00358E079D